MSETVMYNQSNTEKASVLIVEDEDAIRLTLRDFLKKKNYKVYVASDGVGAIKQLLDYDIDVIVTDYRMDVLGGDYWVRFLEKFVKNTCIIIMSGFLKSKVTIPFPVLYKPFDYVELEKLIEKSLTQKAKQE